MIRVHAAPAAPRTGRKRLRSETVATQLRELIAEEGLDTGDRLPTESELAERFEVSRVSIREATKALCFLGILESRPRRGTVIGTILLDRLMELASFQLTIDQASAQDALASRLCSELDALTRLGPKAELPIAGRLKDILTAMDMAPESDEAVQLWRRTTITFHSELMAAAGNVAARRFVEMLMATLDPVLRAGGDAELRRRTIMDMATICEDLQAGRIEQARATLDALLRLHHAVEA